MLRADRLATLGGIAAGFAHEIGNSLNVIRGFSSVAAREVPADSPANRPDVEAIRREVGRAASLIERFLVFARARTAHPHPQPIEPVVREAVEVVGPAATQARVERVLEVEDGLPLVDADAELLRQAFLNLCVNAIQAMQEPGGGGRLTVRARRDGDGVLVEVSDTGPGIDAETRAHVFEPFFTTKATGTGLGLAIVRQAVEAHGGAVEVESAPGAGATFRVRLPAPAAPAPERRWREAEREAAKPKLMVVDDLDSARQMVKRVLGAELRRLRLRVGRRGAPGPRPGRASTSSSPTCACRASTGSRGSAGSRRRSRRSRSSSSRPSPRSRPRWRR